MAEKYFKLFNIKDEDDQKEMEDWVSWCLNSCRRIVSFDQVPKKGFTEIRIIMEEDE